MCRKNQIWGIAVLAFGLGVMVGCWVEPAFVRNLIGIGLIAGGILILQKK